MSPRTQQQFKEMREEKMTLIMDAALEHFANEGYFRTTISHLARHTGMSKGLMYNYFESKEALLRAIIHKSVNEIYQYLDIDRDGYLSENEFEFFIRKINVLLKGKRHFWKLLMQLLMQNDVRQQFLEAYPDSDSLLHPGHEPGDNYYPSRMLRIIGEYFERKKEKMGEDYDPEADLNMFICSLIGFAVTSIFTDDDEKNENAMNRIIELYK